MEKHLISKVLTILVLSFCFAYSQFYRGAELRTLEPVLYGKFEARYKPAQGEGLVSSFLSIMMTSPTLAGLRLMWKF